MLKNGLKCESPRTVLLYLFGLIEMNKMFIRLYFIRKVSSFFWINLVAPLFLSHPSFVSLSPSPPPVGVALFHFLLRLPRLEPQWSRQTGTNWKLTHTHTRTLLEPISFSGWQSEYN